ncbi:MAG: hypothetical protein QMD85_03825 [Candidatus Aenigmarchaeota archaeon]|nr:hypothetical protein [Candidatus Aenigmarchaeota archaeon]MDI6722685.1 hypothetical protein [Candidatus Aenigmarchaeota archaeon]
MQEGMKYIGMIGAVLIGFFGTVALGIRIYNNQWNNQEKKTPGYHMISHATGVGGHIEYSRYSDGSHDVKVYPDLHRFFDSDLYQDLDGDGDVDRIRRQGAEPKMNRLTELLVREHDYESNRERFDKADNLLQELMKKYPEQVLR